jgi:hypothetical protein
MCVLAGDCGQRIFAQAAIRPCRRGQVAMRIKRTSPEEKERATRDKDINEKKVSTWDKENHEKKVLRALA